jgi:hypothetical protein
VDAQAVNSGEQPALIRDLNSLATEPGRCRAG